MGARQSKRSVDITTTPKKDGLPAEGSVAGDAAAPGDGKLERIEETDGKPTTNGTAPHADAAAVIDDKDNKDKEQDKENDKEKEKEKEKDKDEDNEKEDVKAEDNTRSESNTETPAEAEEATTPTDGATPTSPDSATSPDSKDAKKKEKKKKWSFRSLSFGKRDRNKTAREDAPKNGDVTKEEPLAEGGEEAEAAVPVEESPAAEEKTAVSSPTVESTPAPATVQEEEKAAAPASPTPVEEKKEEPTPAPTPVPVEEKKVEIEKVEPVVAEKVEVSPVQAISSPVGVNQAQPIATPSIIERKTSEDLPPPLPSSPPPTPIDPSPLQQAQQTAANASALAEALKVPAEAASMASQIDKEPIDSARSVDELKNHVVTESNLLESKVTELVSEVKDSIKDAESHISKDCEIVEEVVKSDPEQSSEIEIITIPIEGKTVETVRQEIMENGVSEHSASSENLVSFEKSDLNTETIVEPSVTQKENDLSKKSGDLVIQSEEGPLPLSEESLVEAKPALVVAEDDLNKVVETVDVKVSQGVEEVSKTVDVVLEADKISVVQSDFNTLLPDAELVELEKPALNSHEVLANQTQSEPVIPTKIESIDEVVPPLPESPIPSFDKASDLIIGLNDGSEISSKIDEISEVVFDPIEELRACHMSADTILSPAKDIIPEISTSVTETVLNASVSSPLLVKLSSPINEVIPDFPSCPSPVKDTSNLLDDLPIPPSDIHNDVEEELICSLPTKNLPNPESHHFEEIISELERSTPLIQSIVQSVNSIEEPLSDEGKPSSPTLNPSPSNFVISPKESSQSKLIEDQSNQEFEVESLSQSLNSYNDSDVQLKERLAESEGLVNGVENTSSCPLLKAVPTDVPDNAQKIAEPEAPAENPAEVSTTESVVEAPACPASPAPQVQVELPVLPPSEPAITEDVASVTKAIEETDISDKAVAAAVNEAIESANTNELVTDSHHQNVINE